MQFIKTFESYVLDGKLIDSASFQKALRFLDREDEEDDATPTSVADELDAKRRGPEFLDSLPALDYTQYDLRRLHQDLQKDVETLSGIWDLIREIRPAQDKKLHKLRELLKGELRGKKLLLFTYYKDTARYLYRELMNEKIATFWKALGNPNVRRMDSGAFPKKENH